jgi:hypothetical protein
MAAFRRDEGGETLIPVQMQPEPVSFDATVRAPGAAFLKRHPNPTNVHFKKSQYWKESLEDLKTSYREVCAYTAIRVGLSGSVDHFLPKSARPDLAFEWTNFRLAVDKINNYKDNSTNVLDPFLIQVGWFALDFASFYVQPGTSLASDIHKSVVRTIEILRLNRDDALVKLRYTVVREYASGDLTLDFLKRWYPFVASELIRQNITESIKGSW